MDGSWNRNETHEDRPPWRLKASGLTRHLKTSKLLGSVSGAAVSAERTESTRLRSTIDFYSADEPSFSP